MERVAFCEQTAARLVALRDELARRAFPQPATRAGQRGLDEEQERHATVLARIAAALDKVSALRVSTAPQQDAEQHELERELEAISELRKLL